MMELMRVNLEALTTARARELGICWRRCTGIIESLEDRVSYCAMRPGSSSTSANVSRHQLSIHYFSALEVCYENAACATARYKFTFDIWHWQQEVYFDEQSVNEIETPEQLLSRVTRRLQTCEAAKKRTRVSISWTAVVLLLLLVRSVCHCK